MALDADSKLESVPDADFEVRASCDQSQEPVTAFPFAASAGAA